MIYIIKGRQRVGKTTLSTLLAAKYVRDFDYKLDDTTANYHLYKSFSQKIELPRRTELAGSGGYLYVTNLGMRAAVKQMVHDGATRKIYLIDEIDRVFSHRFWSDKAQAETLLGLWQDEKLENVIIGTCHVGRSIDILIRQSMQYELVVLKQIGDVMVFGMIDILNHRPATIWTASGTHMVQDKFNTREPVK